MPPSSRFTLPNGVPCSPDLGSGEELSFPQSRLPSSASTGLGLTPAGRLERLIRSPLYRKLSSAPDTFLLPRRASDLHWASLSCLSTGAIIYHSPLSCKHSFLPVKGSRMSPQMFCPMSESPSGKREGFQDNATHTHTKKKTGSLLLTRATAFCCNHRSGAGSESPEQRLLPKFIRYA